MSSNSGRVIEIFTKAIQLSNEERVAFLEGVCAEDRELRHQIEALLKSNERVGVFLEDPPSPTIGEVRAKVSIGEKPGDRVDRYKLLEQIGEGGWGIVFVAEQEQPVLRRVALKVVKPGMDTKSVIARFEAERQALALMDHPNIAHVLDAGATASGRPYFVMELVNGVKITDYCDRHLLSTEARLKLFVQVCDAVQHAHQKGIIHRDIKPSNILVTTTPGGKPVPKVIDFGIAKATSGGRLTDKTIFTSAEMMIGTPAYMSPEQAGLTTVEVDTRTDIYSLGVLLYELLTGTTPFDTRELLKAGMDEVRRVIRDEEPLRPSTRLQTTIAADLASISKQHGTKAPKLIREMRGELDWIVMKALEKDRERRYATANGFTMDINRYLSGEAILARPPSAAYRFRKLVARNKLGFTAITLIAMLLVVSLTATTRWLVTERHAKEQMSQQIELARLDSLGLELYYQGKSTEAEQTMLKALNMRGQFPDAEYTSKLLRQSVLVALYINERQFDKIKPFFDAYIDPLHLSKSESKTSMFEAAVNALAKNGRWSEAAPLAYDLHKADPNSVANYHKLLPVLVANGDFEKYRLLCREAVARFRQTTNVFDADKMAKDCLIHPSADVDLKAVSAMADLAVTKGKDYSAFHFFQCCKAMAEYRLGNYKEAVNWAQASAKNSFPHSQAEAYAILAMAQYKLGNIEAARRELTNCNRVIETKLPREGDLGNDWVDVIIARTLQSEARQLIEGESSSVAPPANLPR